MTNKIEKQFFDTFGIEPSTKYDYCWKSKENKDKLYPQITDRILLELICIANKYYIDLEGTDIETMKNSLLENFMFFKRDVKEDIHTLFKGNNNDNKQR